ncbi:hypothetical protein [Prevotella histicola]|nr:hypothetical protein [Prevotella histicola]
MGNYNATDDATTPPQMGNNDMKNQGEDDNYRQNQHPISNA